MNSKQDTKKGGSTLKKHSFHQCKYFPPHVQTRIHVFEGSCAARNISTVAKTINTNTTSNRCIRDRVLSHFSRFLRAPRWIMRNGNCQSMPGKEFAGFRGTLQQNVERVARVRTREKRRGLDEVVGWKDRSIVNFLACGQRRVHGEV